MGTGHLGHFRDTALAESDGDSDCCGEITILYTLQTLVLDQMAWSCVIGEEAEVHGDIFLDPKPTHVSAMVE